MNEAYSALDSLFDATESTPYPHQWTPFVRQFRFAIHACRYVVDFRSSGATEDESIFAAVAISVYTTLQTECYQRYADVWVELERIAYTDLPCQSHRLPTRSTCVARSTTFTDQLPSAFPTDNLGITYRIDPNPDIGADLSFANKRASNGTLVLKITARGQVDKMVLNLSVEGKYKRLGAWSMLGRDTEDPIVFRFLLETDIPADEIAYYRLGFDGE